MRYSSARSFACTRPRRFSFSRDARAQPEHAAHCDDRLRHPDRDRHAEQRLRGHALHGLSDLRGARARGTSRAPTSSRDCGPASRKAWEQAKDDKKTWIFHLRRGVKFHDGTDFTADAVIWNLDRYFKQDSPQFEPPASGISRARVPLMDSYKKIDDYTVSITTSRSVRTSRIWRCTCCSPRRPRSRRREGLGQGRGASRGRHRPVQDHQGRAARELSISCATTATGTRRARRRSMASA